MSEHDELLATVLDLVSRKTEGRYWDFKLLHHENRAELIHDILNLANAEHHGRRYLIFGVEDKSYDLHSITGTPSHRSQADIADFLRANTRKFSQSRTPDVYLLEIQHDGKVLDVLVIEDRPYKPYSLVEDYKDRGKTVCAHHIYSRSNDTNTPMPESAPPHEVERMWRERFGLDKTPLDRAKIYLERPSGWVAISKGPILSRHYEYHRQFPEFTVHNSEADHMTARNEEWTRGEIRKDNNHAWYKEVYYHQTLLATVRGVTFDDGKKEMVAPEWAARSAGRFYYYEQDSIEYALQTFLWSSRTGFDHSNRLSFHVTGDEELLNRARMLWPDGYVKIPVLRAGELERFLGPRQGQVQDPSTDHNEQYQLFLRNQIEFEEWRRNTGHP